MLKNLTFAAIVGFALAFTGAAAQAQQNIGSTALARNDVKREGAGAITAGDAVFLNEIVRTGEDSAARLLFLDQTSLAVGPVARVVLDRFVYDPSPNAQAMSVNLAKGAFRFTTGVLDKKAYSIGTPTASIGVRGTVLDLDVTPGRSRVTLIEGRALVCPRGKGDAFEQIARDCARTGAPATKIGGQSRRCECLTLQNPGQTVTVTATGGGGAKGVYTTAPSTFASLCAGDPALCSASVDVASIGGGALCGR